jgi:hypothetical protein
MRQFVSEEVIINCLRWLIKPLARYCLKHGLHFQDLLACTKSALVEVAKEELERINEEPSVSKISVMTGLQRRNVTSLLESGGAINNTGSLMSKILGLWQTDSCFLTKAKKPRVLTVSEEANEFDTLVKVVSKDLSPASVLFELERIGAVIKTKRGIELIVQAYVPRGNFEKGFEIVSSDINDIINLASANLENPDRPPHLHLRTNYDRIRKNEITKINRWIIEQGHDFHARARTYIAQFDQDITPDLDYSGEFGQITLSSFSSTDIKE